MKLPRTLKFFAPLTFALALALGGCASASPDEEVASAAEAASETESPHAHGKFGRHHGGGHHLLGAALHELDDLTPEQRKTIEGAMQSLDGTHEADRQAFHKALADGVRAGKIDEAAVKAKLGDTEKLASERRAAVVKALGTLHATLTPAQRVALATHVEERMEKFAGKHGPEGMKRGRHHGPEDGERGPRGPEGMKRGPRGEHGPMGFFLHGLELREEQKTQIHAALEASRPEKPEMHGKMDKEAWAKKHEEHRARMKAAIASFRTDTFDAEALLPPKDARPMPMMMGDHLVKALSAIVPVLDEGQRGALAQRIEEGPKMPHFRGKRGGKHGRHHEGATQAPPSR
ncbi:periplasmic heavy metal sensor [Polyangium spumosum]|nr:periplasmic heavy metal sensor [Polyangium spumosum]